MKHIAFTILFFFVFLISCKEKDKPNDNFEQTTFEIGGSQYKSISTILYRTSFGQVLGILGDGFEFYISMSDNSGSTFEITDTLTGSDTGKTKCILKMGNDYKFSTSGFINYDQLTNTGDFTLTIEDLELKNGKIVVDSVVNKSIVDFTNISMFDYQGASMNNGDPNDWKIRTSWEVIERLVINTKLQNTLAGSLEMIEYPNPFNSVFQMQLPISQGYMAELIFVNPNFEIEKVIRELQPGNHAFLFENPAYIGNYYRLYYRLYSDSDEYFGSGDLQISE